MSACAKSRGQDDASAIASRLKRDANGLFTAVVQERGTGQVLMVAWMDDIALARTLETRKATYYSRSRGEHWVKGETSGHTQHVHSVRLDCDGDTVLLEVDQVGGACHTGDHTCFDADLLLGSRGLSCRVKRVAAVAVLGGAALAARRYLSMRDALAAVPPDLRSPVLPFVLWHNQRGRCRCTAWSLGCARRRAAASRWPSGILGDQRVPVLVTTPIESGVHDRACSGSTAAAYILGSPQMEAFGTGRLARDLGVVTVSPDYRLAPEHPFPAALDDCMATLRWMRANADELGIDPDRIAVMGASAGGGLVGRGRAAQLRRGNSVARAGAGVPDARRPHRAA